MEQQSNQSEIRAADGATGTHTQDAAPTPMGPLELICKMVQFWANAAHCLNKSFKTNKGKQNLLMYAQLEKHYAMMLSSSTYGCRISFA